MAGNVSSSEAENSSSPPTRAGLAKWWKRFNSKKPALDTNSQGASHAAPAGVFGVSLQDSLRYASIAISQVAPDGKARIYGHIPVVVAKTGLYLKQNGTTTQGVFRVSGSNKRIKELEQIFDSGPEYGKEIQWDTYSVHDAASVFRRYLNMLPEPIIPFVLYQSFQDALPRKDQKVQKSSEAREPAIKAYRDLINSLPPASQHIFFYVLDLLGVFAKKSEQNLMPASNLATIFQPGLLRHQPSTVIPSEDDKDAVKAQIEADANEHKRSQEVLEFLIENQKRFELELPESVLAAKKARRKSPTMAIGALVSNISGPSKSRKEKDPATKSKSLQSTGRTSKPSSPMLGGNEDSLWSTKKETDLVRRGSDKSDHRKHLRRKKAAEQKRTEGGATGVRRSRTLPSSKEGRPTSASKSKEDAILAVEELDDIKPLRTSQATPRTTTSTSTTSPISLVVPHKAASTGARRHSAQSGLSDEIAGLSSATASPVSPHGESASDSGVSGTALVSVTKSNSPLPSPIIMPQSPPPEKKGGWFKSKRSSMTSPTLELTSSKSR